MENIDYKNFKWIVGDVYMLSALMWWFYVKFVVSRLNIKNGCVFVWYLMLFLMGFGKKNLNWKKICGKIK